MPDVSLYLTEYELELLILLIGISLETWKYSSNKGEITEEILRDGYIIHKELLNTAIYQIVNRILIERKEQPG